MVNILKEEGYLDTDEIADIPDYVNEEFGTETRKYRQKRRKQKFLIESHDEIYDDWVINKSIGLNAGHMIISQH
ncbi:MAG: hypothetical protein ACFE9S_15725 [Candidatus Hermodarchaeota archaeon]